MDAKRVTPFHLARRVAIETPESVTIELELAGVGSRFAAAALDMALLMMVLLLLLLALGYFGDAETKSGGWFAAIFILITFAAFWGYFALFEGLMNGQTPGKRSVGLRVVMDTGHPLTFGAAVSRNLLRLVDSQPAFLYAIGIGFVFFHPQNKRLGDIVAGTLVVRDRPSDQRLDVRLDYVAAPAVGIAEAPELSDEEFRVLEQFLARRGEFDPSVRNRVALDLLKRFAERLPRDSRGVEGKLEALFAAERARRGGALAASGASRGSSVGTTRFIARKQASWEAFRVAALEAERHGLRGMSGEELTAFAARYREAAADLARARTYGVDARLVGWLERAVSAGHNALYGLRGVARMPLGRLALRDLPAAVWRSRGYVLTAFLITVLPGIGGYALMRDQPASAVELLPDEMIARAEAGVAEAREGIGYAQMPSPFLPVMASQIIANNIQVSIAAFAFGITAGLGTVYVLFFNGLSIGAVMGMFANYGLLGWLVTFMAAHGVLELTAIFIAGGAGLRIGRAMLAPGDVSRRDAMIVAGREALLLICSCFGLLLLAGTIEGLLSASDAAPVVKIGVSAASAVLLGLFAIAGRGDRGNRGDRGPKERRS